MKSTKRAQRRKYHFIYKTTCLITSRYYYGMHSTDNLDDGYIGSGKRLWYSINKYGKENHKIEKLEFFKTREELKNKEIEIVNEELLKNPMCMNIQLGGGGGLGIDNGYKWHSAGGKAAGFLHKERLLSDKNYRNAFVECVKKNWDKSLEKSHLLWRGKKHSEESKEKMRNHKGKQKGEKNSQYGTCWINNGIENKKIKKIDIIPFSWNYGRIIK